ncbi:hypothetical protein [Streptomyces noursei]|uniref:hypothetical protein n=1 Tax=Streptomyces noursei TaxID=1971 RepID=UPI0023B7C8B4|nr:hypothetical protein [Streptomyces noursei]
MLGTDTHDLNDAIDRSAKRLMDAVMSDCRDHIPQYAAGLTALLELRRAKAEAALARRSN